jgi:hypothetical protein
MEEALIEFGKVLGKLKQAFAAEYNTNSNSIEIIINQDNYVTMVDARSTGGCIDVHRQWVDTE